MQFYLCSRILGDYIDINLLGAARADDASRTQRFLGSRRNQMEQKTLRTISISSLALLATLVAVLSAQAQETKTTYPSMAPPDQYLMERDAEIALARTAAPASISQDAEVMVLGRHDYETAVKGKNGFMCMVLRSWTAGTDDPEFWNPKVRSPICFNASAMRSYVPQVIMKTKSILAGQSKDEMAEEIRVALDKKELPSQEPGAMCYMMSKQGHLNDRAGHWHPHLMFFVPLADSTTWGADLEGSPIIAAPDTLGRLTIFMVPVGHWSDGTAANE
jgi:hypothetical protein